VVRVAVVVEGKDCVVDVKVVVVFVVSVVVLEVLVVLVLLVVVVVSVVVVLVVVVVHVCVVLVVVVVVVVEVVVVVLLVVVVVVLLCVDVIVLKVAVVVVVVVLVVVGKKGLIIKLHKPPSTGNRRTPRSNERMMTGGVQTLRVIVEMLNSCRRDNSAVSCSFIAHPRSRRTFHHPDASKPPATRRLEQDTT